MAVTLAIVLDAERQVNGPTPPGRQCAGWRASENGDERGQDTLPEPAFSALQRDVLRQVMTA